MDETTLKAYDVAAASFASEWEEEQAPPGDLQAIIQQYFRIGPTADIGCGSGRDTAWLSGQGFDVVGIDPSAGLLAQASQRHPGVRFQRGELPALDGFAAGGFENVFCETFIMHLDPALIAASVQSLVPLLNGGDTLYLSWRVTRGSDQRDAHGRLYSAFDPSLVREALAQMKIELDQDVISASSQKVVHRIVARKG